MRERQVTGTRQMAGYDLDRRIAAVNDGLATQRLFDI